MRYSSIDVLRTVSILLMVIVHFLENLSGQNWTPAGFGAPMFGFLVGVSYYLWCRGERAKGLYEEAITSATLRRGLFLFGLGLLFNVIVWLPGDTFNWDVLTLLGTALFVLALLREAPTPIPLLICTLVFVLSPILRLHSDYAEYWIEGYYDPDWQFSQLALGYLVNGYFPLFPWLIFPLLGYVVGGWLFSTAEVPPSRVQLLGLLGAVLLLTTLALRLWQPESHGGTVAQLLGKWTMFPPSTTYVTGVLGVTLLAFAVALYGIDGRRWLDRVPRLLSFAQLISKYSLTIYVLHHVLHLWPLWVYGLVMGPEVTAYWRQAFPWEVSLALCVPCFALMYAVVRWLDRTQRPSIETVMRRVSQRRTGTPEMPIGQ